MKHVALIPIVLFAATLTADAGKKANDHNFVYIDGWRASGDIGAVRATADTVETIGCRVEGWQSASTPSVLCWARDMNNNYLSCTYSGQAAPLAVAGLNGDSRLEFAWNTGTTCYYVAVSNSSEYRPKAL